MIKIFNKEKFNQLNYYIDYNEKQSNLYMTNQYFDILPKLLSEGKLKSSSHLTFTYSYIYFMTYMFRYTKYDQAPFRASEVKELLGYNEKDKRIDYIIKNRGVLDEEDILKTIYDFPVVHEYDKYSDTLEFTMISHFDEWYINEWKQTIRNNKFKLPESEIQEGKKNIVTKNQYSKYPVLAFYDDISFYEDIVFVNEGGTFYDITNTTNIQFEVFNYFMSNNELGCDGFYIYSFLKHKNNIFGDYNATYQTISNAVTLSPRTVQKYIEAMRSFNVVNTIHNMEYFSTGIDKEDRRASTHKTNEFAEFTYTKQNYKKLEIVLKKDHYRKLNIKSTFKSVVYDSDQLPF